MGKKRSTATEAVKQVVAHSAAEAQAQGVVDEPLGTSNNPSSAVLTLANLITACRFVLTVVFLWLFVQNNPQTRTAALLCYAIAASTDFLDGMVARATQTVSWAGKIMDPIMDRFLLFTGVLGLMIIGELPVWVAVFVVCRDIYLAAGALWVRRYRSRPIDVVYIGKVTTALLMSGFVLLLINVPRVAGLGWVNVDWLPGFNSQTVAVGIFFVYAGVICSFITAVIYSIEGIRIVRDALKETSETHA